MEKLNCKSLMIGDWVMVVKCVADAHFMDYPDKVKSICDGLVGLESDGLETIIERIAPISLTPEILKKNGFEFNDLPMEQCWQQYGLHLYLNGHGYGINCGENVSLRIRYVHELQHVLRLCNINIDIKL